MKVSQAIEIMQKFLKADANAEVKFVDGGFLLKDKV